MSAIVVGLIYVAFLIGVLVGGFVAVYFAGDC